LRELSRDCSRCAHSLLLRLRIEQAVGRHL
jgi:hypothetical protein